MNFDITFLTKTEMEKVFIVEIMISFRYDVDETSPDKSDNAAYEIMSKSML